MSKGFFSAIGLCKNLEMNSSKIQAQEESKLSNDAENIIFSAIINIKDKNTTCLKQCLLFSSFIW